MIVGMTFSRTALAVVGAAMVAGGAYGVWQYRHAPAVQTAMVSDTVTPQAGIAGTWTSTDDGAYTVTFNADGSVEETYGTSTVSRGTYVLAASPAGYVSSETAFPTLGDRDYLLEELDGEKYAYRVIELTDTSLQLTYLGRGNTLGFTR